MPGSSSFSDTNPEGLGALTVSVVNEFPEDLYEAMRRFVGAHPSWDQYRVMQVALAGFLFQQGSRERAVARHYLDGLFDRAVLPESAAQQPPAATSAPSLPLASRSAVSSAQDAALPPAAPELSQGGPARQPTPPDRSETSPVLPVPSSCMAPTTGPLLHRLGAPLPPRRLR